MLINVDKSGSVPTPTILKAYPTTAGEGASLATVSRTGTGKFTINFMTNFSAPGPVVLAMPEEDQPSSGNVQYHATVLSLARNSVSIGIWAGWGEGQAVEPDRIHVLIAGD